MMVAKNRADWGRTSSVIAVLVNINRDPKTRAFQPHEFNPYADKSAKQNKPDFYITPGQFAKKLVARGDF